MSQFRYKAFISYSHADESWARWLHRSLEWYRLPKRIVGRETPRGPIPRRLTPIFRDREELASASDLGSVLEDALTNSQALIVICSPASARSRWVNEEIRFFKSLGRADQVFCLIVDGEPNADSSDGQGEECFPEALREAGANRDESAQAEPIAADLRPGGDGRQAAKLKLVAGLLGVGLDEIRQRENQRRQRRLIQIASGAIVGMLIASALATAALMARAEADRQRIRAEQQAETASQTSEFLVSLFAVVDPSESRGDTVTAREILDRGAAKIESELQDQPAVRANLLDTMGRVYQGLGLYSDSEDLLAKSLAVGRDAGRSGTARQISTSTALAETFLNNAKYSEAIALATRAVADARKMQGASGELAGALIARADALLYFKEHVRAEAIYQEALSITETLTGSDPDAETLTAKALNGLGKSLFGQQRFDEAISKTTRALAIRESVLGQDHPDTFATLNDLNYFYYATDRRAELIQVYRQILRTSVRVFGENHPYTATYLNNLGRLLLEADNSVEAESLLMRAVRIDEEVTFQEHDDQALSLNNRALSRAAVGRFDDAEPDYREGLELARFHGNRMQGPILANLADLLCATGRAGEGLENAEEAETKLMEFPNDYAKDNWRYAHLASVKGGCLVRHGDIEGGSELLRQAYVKLKSEKGSDWLFTRLARDRLSLLTNDAPQQ